MVSKFDIKMNKIIETHSWFRNWETVRFFISFSSMACSLHSKILFAESQFGLLGNKPLSQFLSQSNGSALSWSKKMWTLHLRENARNKTNSVELVYYFILQTCTFRWNYIEVTQIQTQMLNYNFKNQSFGQFKIGKPKFNYRLLHFNYTQQTENIWCSKATGISACFHSTIAVFYCTHSFFKNQPIFDWSHAINADS